MWKKSSRGCVRKSRRHKKKTWMMMSFFRIFIAYSSSVPFLSASITFRREFYNHKKVQLVTQNTSALLMSNWSTLQIILRSLHLLSDPSPIIVYPCQWLTDWLTHCCLVNLIDVTLACEEAKSKLVEVVTAAESWGSCWQQFVADLKAEVWL